MIIIVGAGIIGLFIAHKLVSKGLKVKIFDANDIVGNSTDASVGMLAPMIETKPLEDDLLKLMLESKKIWDSQKGLDKEKKNIGLKKNSSLLVAQNIDDLEKIKFKKVFLEKLGLKTKLLDQKETLKLEPELNTNIIGSLFCQDQNQVNSHKLKSFLINKLSQMDCEIIKVQKLEKISLFEKFVKLDNTKIKAEKVIIACGVWSEQLIKKSFDISLPLRPIKGVSMLLDAGRELFTNNLWFKNIYVAPREKNILAIGATEEEKGFNTSITMDEIYFLSKNAWEIFPDLENFKLLEFKSGIRPSVIDGNPIIGSLSSVAPNVICAFGHYRHGILLAPVTAKLVCDYVFGEKIKKNHNFFSPERFNL